MSDQNININLDEDLTKQVTIHKNLGQEIILTTTDKVKIILAEHHKIIKSKSDWIGPCSIFVTVLLTLLTAKFDANAFGIDHEIWKAIFMLTCFGTFIWSSIWGIRALLNLKKGTIDEVIEKLKKK